MTCWDTTLCQFVDAYLKGIHNFDVEKAYEAVKYSAEMDRLGLKYYKKIGFLPCDRQGESVSKTLEYCYDDWCISQMAKAMDRQFDYENYHQRAHNWKNVFDPSVGFMRGRKSDRAWLEPFDPLVNSVYSEGNAYQYMYVPHDINGLIGQMGGNQKFIEWLDLLFSLKSDRSERGAIGQYWHGNEPSHHLAYLYNYAGEAWKTQKLVDQILTKLYSTAPDGLAGNDDCGQISAWYIMSSMGFYPVAPGMPVYAIGSPLFNKVTIHLENGKKFVIKANNRTKDNFYIQSAKLNGKAYKKSFLRHEDIMNGGELVFEMGAKPNKNWGAAMENRCRSDNGKAIARIPYIKSGDLLFQESTLVELASDPENSSIRYTLDGTEPSEKSLLYTQPFKIRESATLKMKAFAPDKQPSAGVEYKFEKAKLLEASQAHVKPGLAYDYFERFFVTTSDLEISEPIEKGTTGNFNISKRKRENYFGFRFEGYINASKDGLYDFYLKSNDGSCLYIDGKEIIENDANHAAVEEPGRVGLKAGLHHILVKYFQCGGNKGLEVSWNGPGFDKHEIKDNELFTDY